MPSNAKRKYESYKWGVLQNPSNTNPESRYAVAQKITVLIAKDVLLNIYSTVMLFDASLLLYNVMYINFPPV